MNLHEHNIKVLSPADPRVVDSLDDFLFVASDRVRSVRLVQDRHLQSILAADFVWLVAPDGYVGQSAAMEIGFAIANAVPIFSLNLPTDMTLRQYVRQVQSLRQAIQHGRVTGRVKPETFLIDPHASLERAQTRLEEINRIMEHSPRASFDASDAVYSRCQEVTGLLSIPGRHALFES
jgi:hypothetical protein